MRSAVRKIQIAAGRESKILFVDPMQTGTIDDVWLSAGLKATAVVAHDGRK
jgi:hypothetical protein